MSTELNMTIEADDRGGSGYLITAEFEEGLVSLASNENENIITIPQNLFEELALKYINEVM